MSRPADGDLGETVAPSKSSQDTSYNDFMTSKKDSTVVADDISDYGSDLGSEGEQELTELLARLESSAAVALELESLEVSLASQSSVAHVPLHDPPSREDVGGTSRPSERREARKVSQEVYYDAQSFQDDVVPRQNVVTDTRPDSTATESPQNLAVDNRSPLERFRTQPNKPLSVTDIISPAWCELQYWFTLTKHGRKRRTPAMKQGSKVHKVLEEEVHRVIPVDVRTKEDAWGLKLWNVIQGLRTLRFTGMTRELEVWGLVGGEVINGVIDELSYDKPEKRVRKRQTEKDDTVGKDDGRESQQTLTDYWATHGANTIENEFSGPIKTKTTEGRKIYITDVKTRGSKYLPKGSSMRPTVMQLMLYKRLLKELASDSVDSSKVFYRYGLKENEPFSDSLVAQIGNLDFNFREDSSEDDIAPFGSQDDSVSELLRCNSLAKLWRLMIHEFQSTINDATGLGETLRAEFRSQQDGSLLGSRVFEHDEDRLSTYLKDELSWWLGEREARGVDVEDAFKCSICDFADDCSWRITKVGEAVQKYRRTAAQTNTATTEKLTNIISA